MRTIWWVVVVWNESHRKVLTLNASNVTQHLRRSHQLDALSNILSTSAHHIWWWGSYTFRYMNNIDFVIWQLLVLYSSLTVRQCLRVWSKVWALGITGLLSSLATYQHWYFVQILSELGRMEVDCFIMFVQSLFMPSTPPSMNAIRKWCLDGFSVLAYQLQESEELSLLSFREGWCFSILCSQDHWLL